MKLPIPRLKKPDFSDPVVRIQTLLLGGAFVFITILLVAVATPLSSNPAFCGKTCHNMNPEYQTWKRSAHAKVTCTACHVDATAWGLIEEKLIESGKGILHTLTNSNEKPINAESHYSQQRLPMARCERCHTNENRKFTFSKGIYMDHLAHKQAEINCAVCHNRITHKGAEKYEPLKSEWEEARGHKWKNYLKMKEGCLRCHSTYDGTRDSETLKLIKEGKKPPTGCPICHTKEFKLPVGHAKKDWRSKHGPIASKDFAFCFGCHDAGAKFDDRGKIWCRHCHDAAKVKEFKAQAKQSG